VRSRANYAATWSCYAAHSTRHRRLIEGGGRVKSLRQMGRKATQLVTLRALKIFDFGNFVEKLSTCCDFPHF
jgi:hypothetical protein